jgi:hypothetical protein
MSANATIPRFRHFTLPVLAVAALSLTACGSGNDINTLISTPTVQAPVKDYASFEVEARRLPTLQFSTEPSSVYRELADTICTALTSAPGKSYYDIASGIYPSQPVKFRDGVALQQLATRYICPDQAREVNA